jgi:hypothetical protein
MSIFNYARRFIIIVASICLSACAANVVKTDAKGQPASGSKIAIQPDATKKINLAIGGSEATITRSDWQAFVDEWLTSMSAETSTAGIGFSLLKGEEPAPSEPSTLVKITVNDFRYMSQAKRYATGVLAGNAYMNLDVEFVEMPSRKIAGTRKYNTSTSGGQGIFSAATPKQVQAVAADIVNEVKGSSPSN